MRFALSTLACLVIVAGQVRSDDGLPADTLDRLKGVTVFVKVAAGAESGSGSGFLVRSDGDTAYVVTNDHVVSARKRVVLVPARPSLGRPPRLVPVIVSSNSRPTLTVVFFSGTAREKACPAELLGSDEVRDLAILRVANAPVLPTPLELDQEVKLSETMPVYVLGFPFGELLDSKKRNPAITIGKASISSLRTDDAGELDHVQLDGTLNPGNSGGPVVDTRGRLIGIARATLVTREGNTSISKAIPAATLRNLLQGSVSSCSLRLLRRDKGTIEIEAVADLMGPFDKVRLAHLYYVSGPSGDNKSIASLPEAKKLVLRIEKQKARGAITVPVKPKDEVRLAFQVECVNGAGMKVLGPVQTSRFGEPTSPVAQSGPVLPPPQAPLPATKLPGLLAYWPFDDAKPDVKVTSLAGKDQDGKAVEAEAVEGIRGKALALKGIDSYFDFSASPLLSYKAGSPFTMAFWVRSQSASGTIISQRNSAEDGADLDFLIEAGKLVVTVRQDRALAAVRVATSFAVNDDRWHHCALTRAGNTVELFVDGSQVQSASAAGLDGPITTDWRFVGRENRWLQAGQQRFLGVDAFLDGAVDEFCIFNRVLNEEEICLLAGRPLPAVTKLRGRVRFLSELEEYGVRSGPWPFKKADTGEGKPISVNGTVSPHGLGMHPPAAPAYAAVRYRLGKQAESFKTTVAINDTSNWCWSPATFTVLGDGKELWRSKWIAHNHARSQDCQVDIKGVDVLELRVQVVNGNVGVQAVWVEPQVLLPETAQMNEAPREKRTAPPPIKIELQLDKEEQ
jgi:S1-C subfamily serine protease